jgi:phage terminase large subunit-like protein
MATLSAPSKLFEALVADGAVKHDGNPCLAWCVTNAELLRDTNENIRPGKPKQRWRRIDGLAALVTGLSRLMVQPDPKKRTGPRILAV